MALLGPDSSQIAREVWAERCGWRQEREYTGGGREPPLCHPPWGLAYMGVGGVGTPTVASLWSLNHQLLRERWPLCFTTTLRALEKCKMSMAIFPAPSAGRGQAGAQWLCFMFTSKK